MTTLRRNGFHARLAEATTKRRIKPLALAAALGVSESAISKWKHGGRISLENTARLCEFCNLSADWLLLNRSPTPPKPPTTPTHGPIAVLWANGPQWSADQPT